jgi:hypothetical protein
MNHYTFPRHRRITTHIQDADRDMKWRTTLQEKRLPAPDKRHSVSTLGAGFLDGTLAKTDSPCRPFDTVSASAGTQCPPSNSSFCRRDHLQQPSMTSMHASPKPQAPSCCHSMPRPPPPPPPTLPPNVVTAPTRKSCQLQHSYRRHAPFQPRGPKGLAEWHLARLCRSRQRLIASSHSTSNQRTLFPMDGCPSRDALHTERSYHTPRQQEHRQGKQASRNRHTAGPALCPCAEIATHGQRIGY